MILAHDSVFRYKKSQLQDMIILRYMDGNCSESLSFIVAAALESLCFVFHQTPNALIVELVAYFPYWRT